MTNTPLFTVDSVSGCWIWARVSTTNGYGIIRRRGRNWVAHRWFWEQIKGPVPANRELDHLCRNRRCVNPDHLEPVTHAENGRRGLATKLDWPRVRKIRELAEHGLLHTEIAERFDIAPRTVTGIVAGDRWKEVGGS